MFCSSCGCQNETDARFCISCGKPLRSLKQQALDNSQPTSSKALEPGRGSTILTLGILSLAVLGPILGIPAWVMGHRDLKKIRAGIIPISHQGSTNSGMILGIIGTFVSPFMIILVGIAIAVGITMFKTNAVAANRDALIGDMTNIAARAQQFYRKPVSISGGGYAFDDSKGAYAAFRLADNEKSNPNGTYTVAVSAQQVTITGTGIEISEDGTGQPVQVMMLVDPESISQTTVVH